MHKVFNSVNPSRIQFTHEIENNNSNSFLEILITRDNKRLTINCHRKPPFSGRFLNVKLQHPLIYKKGIVFNLVDKDILLSDPKFHKENLKLVEQLLIYEWPSPEFFQRFDKEQFTLLFTEK